MAFSVGRLICRRRLTLLSGSSCSRMMSTAIIPNNNNNINAASSSCCCTTPWLMLPAPSLDDKQESRRSLSYKLYSLADNRFVTHMQAGGLSIHSNLRLCGSSHGWVALSNPDTSELFLYDPISHRHINLPPIPKIIPEDSRGVTKLILSSDDVDSCLAVMIYSRYDNMALCFPGRSKEWTPIGKKGGYDDIVYSGRRQNLFFAYNRRDDELETWSTLNVDPSYCSSSSSPRINRMINDEYNCNNNYLDRSPKDRMSYVLKKYLVEADDDLLLLVTRRVMLSVAPDGSYVEYYIHPSSLICPHMTIDFDIQLVYNQARDDDDLIIMPLEELCLGDLALFIGGGGDSVALSATRFPELKPNSIYFTDTHHEEEYNDPSSHDDLFGGHDIGIFDCETRTVSPCSYYPCHVRSLKRIVRSLKRIAPSPVWFFPRRGI